MLTIAPALTGSPMPLDGTGAPVPAEAGRPGADFAAELALAVRALPAAPRGANVVAPAASREAALAPAVAEPSATPVDAETIDAIPFVDVPETGPVTRAETATRTQARAATISAEPMTTSAPRQPSVPSAATPIIADAPVSEGSPGLPEVPEAGAEAEAETTSPALPEAETSEAAPVPASEAPRKAQRVVAKPAVPAPEGADTTPETAQEAPDLPNPRAAAAAEASGLAIADPAPDEAPSSATLAHETSTQADTLPDLTVPVGDPAAEPPEATPPPASAPPSPEALVATVLAAPERPATERPRAPRPTLSADAPVEPASATGSRGPAEATSSEAAAPPRPLPTEIDPAADAAADARPADAPVEAADPSAACAPAADPAAARSEPTARPAAALLAAEAPAAQSPAERPTTATPAAAPHAAARPTPMAPCQQIAPVLITLAAGAPGLPDSLTLTLDPQELGRIEVEVTRESERRVAIAVLAERPETLHLLMRDAALLDRALAQAGVGAEGRSLAFDLGGGSDGRQDRGPAPSRRAEPAATSPAEAPRRGDPLSLLDIAI